MLPISASKIENSAGVPISNEFTTRTLSATTSISTPALSVANNKLTVNSNNITANVPVTINNTLEVKDSTNTSSILKVENNQVVINKPTNITGTTTIKGATQIENSSSEATDGNLTVAGTVGITGKTTIGTDSAKTEIENNKITTSEIIADKINVKKIADIDTYHLVINKEQNNIIEIKNNKNNPIFSVNTDSGVTYAKQINADNINATVEGTIDNAKKAEKVTTYIGDISISSIFETNSSVVRKASSLTATSSTGSAGNIIITGNTNGTVDALIPKKTTGRTYNIGSISQTFDNIYATTFNGSLAGNASTATAFETAASITLTGDVITSTAATGTHGWTVNTTIDKGVVTNDKLKNSSITIGSNTVALGDSIGTSDKPFTGSLYFGGKLTINGEPTGSNDAVRKTELDNTFWLSGGKQLKGSINLDNCKTVGNYFHALDVGSNVTNLPTNADSAFTLKVTALVINDDGTPSFIQQQLRDVSGNIYTRTLIPPASESAAATWSEWSLVLTSEPAKIIGSGSKPVYLANGQLTASVANIGGANKPIWMENGELKNCSGAVGDSSHPIYMGGDGTLTACKYAYTVTNTLPSELQADTIYFITED